MPWTPTEIGTALGAMVGVAYTFIHGGNALWMKWGMKNEPGPTSKNTDESGGSQQGNGATCANHAHDLAKLKEAVGRAEERVSLQNAAITDRVNRIGTSSEKADQELFRQVNQLREILYSIKGAFEAQGRKSDGP